MKILNDVLITKSDWLFLNGGKHAPMEYYLGRKSLSKFCIESFKSNIIERNEFCKNHNIPYLHVVFPGKPAVMKEMLPPACMNIKPIFLPEMENDNVLYPLEALRQTKNCFFQTDTHNSHIGSWSVLELILKHFDLKHTATPIYNKSVKRGDLSRMLGRNDKEQYEEFSHCSNSEYAGFDLGNRSSLKGNTGEIRIIRNCLAPLAKRLLIFADSFVNDIMNRQLANVFQEVIYFRSSSFHYEVIEFIKPDIILSGQAERYLSSVRPDHDREYLLLRLLTSDLSEKSKLPSGFNRALEAIFSPKMSKSYNQWTRDVDAYKLSQLAAKYKDNNQAKCKYYLES
ncbi:MAG: hypothetical protein ACI8O8_003224, partial [Oleiphilaceae bacterium]